MGQQGEGLRDTNPVVAPLPVFIKGMGEEAESRSHPEIAGSSAFHKEAKVPECTVTGRGSSPAVGGQSWGLKTDPQVGKRGCRLHTALPQTPCANPQLCTFCLLGNSRLDGQVSSVALTLVKKGGNIHDLLNPHFSTQLDVSHYCFTDWKEIDFVPCKLF